MVVSVKPVTDHRWHRVSVNIVGDAPLPLRCPGGVRLATIGKTYPIDTDVLVEWRIYDPCYVEVSFLFYKLIEIEGL